MPDQAALEGWITNSPLLVMGSHTWNTPNEKGRLFCDGEKQEQVFASAARWAGSWYCAEMLHSKTVEVAVLCSKSCLIERNACRRRSP